MVQINWTNLAKRELRNIYDYISNDSLEYAKYQVMKIRLRTNILKDHPTIGRVVPEFNNEIIRELIEGNYRIVYRIKNPATIEILTIHHSARNLTDKEIK